MKTLTISKGHQYDKGGYRTSDGQYGEVVDLGDGTTRVTVGGGWLISDDYDHSGQKDMIYAAIRLTVADGRERTVDLKDRVESGLDSPPEIIPNRIVEPCPLCGTYCCGRIAWHWDWTCSGWRRSRLLVVPSGQIGNAASRDVLGVKHPPADGLADAWASRENQENRDCRN